VIKQIYTYALIKSFYETGEDYLDTFYPFIVDIISNKKGGVLINDLQRELESKFGLHIPIHTLNTIATRAKRKGYIESRERKFFLTKKGKEYFGFEKLREEITNEVEYLFSDVVNFIKNKYSISISPSEIKNEFYKFVQKYIDFLTYFLLDEKEYSKLPPSQITPKERFIMDYIIMAKDTKKETFEIIEKIIFGSIISIVLKFEDISKVEQKFKDCEVYLDSNFIFSLLELDRKEFSKPAKELFNLLRLYKFKIKVFSFTLDEISNVLRGYIEKQYDYFYGIKVDSVYSNLKEKGWTSEDVLEFIAELNSKVLNLGIEINWINKDLRSYEGSLEKYRKLLKVYKPNQPTLSQNHDLMAIEEIQKIRKKKPRKLEECRALFLTSDIKLSRFNYEEMGHREGKTVSEVILDRLFTNILWLKNPKLSPKLPLEFFISFYYKNLIIKREIWEKFLSIIKILLNEKKTSIKNVTMLFYHKYIEEELKEFTENDIDKINENYVLKKIEEALEIEKKEKKSHEEKIRKEITESLGKEIKERDFRLQEIFKFIEKTKTEIELHSSKKAKVISWITSFILSAFLSILLVIVYFCFKNKEMPDLYIAFINILLGGGGIWKIFSRLRDIIERRSFKYIYNKEIKKFKVYELQNILSSSKNE